MRGKIFLIFGVIFLMFLINAVSASRMPVINGDLDNWGEILNAFLNVSHNDSGELENDTVSSYQIVNDSIVDDDISDVTNLTLGQKITFAFGELIDNIVDGIINIAGELRVEGRGNFSGTIYINNGTDISLLNETSLINSVNSTYNTGVLYNETASMIANLSISQQPASGVNYWGSNGSNIYNLTAFVGIGTINPTDKLQVFGGNLNMSINNITSVDCIIFKTGGKIYGV